MSHSQSHTALLEQTGWIHALAQRLVQDVHTAEDLAQDTWVDALAQAPDSDRPLRGWLGTAMRNRLSKLRRGEANRAARDQEAARAEELPSTLDVVERAATHRDLVLAVMALEEPYRTTLLMRFFEQLSYGEIARRMGTTRATVNSRITRGLERLRQRLEGTYGADPRALCVALTPLANLSAGSATTLFGIKTMHAVIGTTVVALASVTAGVTLLPTSNEPAQLVATTPDPSPTSSSSVELVPAPAPQRVPAEAAPLESQPVRNSILSQDERNVWKVELFHNMVVPEGIAKLAVNTGSGDIDVETSRSGQLEITAKVTADLEKVDETKLTQLFEDHVRDQ